MPQAQGMIAGHGGGNMVGQTASQGQFLAQTQFPTVAATGVMNVTVEPGIGQPPAQCAVTQVRHDEGCGAVVNKARHRIGLIVFSNAIDPVWRCNKVVLIPGD